MGLLIMSLFVFGLIMAPGLTLAVTLLAAMMYLAAKLWWLWLIIFLIWVVSGMPSTSLDQPPPDRGDPHRQR